MRMYVGIDEYNGIERKRIIQTMLLHLHLLVRNINPSYKKKHKSAYSQYQYSPPAQPAAPQDPSSSCETALPQPSPPSSTFGIVHAGTLRSSRYSLAAAQPASSSSSSAPHHPTSPHHTNLFLYFLLLSSPTNTLSSSTPLYLLSRPLPYLPLYPHSSPASQSVSLRYTAKSSIKNILPFTKQKDPLFHSTLIFPFVFHLSSSPPLSPHRRTKRAKKVTRYMKDKPHHRRVRKQPGALRKGSELAVHASVTSLLDTKWKRGSFDTKWKRAGPLDN
jgi:hypothetical protein